MSGAGRLLERGATFIYLVLFAGIMWPPDAYFSGTMVTPQGQSNIYDFLEFAILMPFLGARASCPAGATCRGSCAAPGRCWRSRCSAF